MGRARITQIFRAYLPKPFTPDEFTVYFSLLLLGYGFSWMNSSCGADICSFSALRGFSSSEYEAGLDTFHRPMREKQNIERITRYADMFSAMGTESRLRILQLLLSAHPHGLIVGDIGDELEILSSTLSHHLEKLKNENLVNVRREGTFLWYSANTEVLQELLGFLYAECCTRKGH
jgi:ArsR family transcriptional regulator